MNALNLVVKFELDGDAEPHVTSAARIKIDGRGGLMLFDAQNSPAETIGIDRLRALRIQPVRASRTSQALRSQA